MAEDMEDGEFTKSSSLQQMCMENLVYQMELFGWKRKRFQGILKWRRYLSDRANENSFGRSVV